MNIEHLNIETKLLEDFLSLAQTRSFSRSAELRHVTQPAFSRRIRHLESLLEVNLVNREVTPVEITSAGMQFRKTAQSVIEQLRASIAYIRCNHNRQSLVVDFAATHVLASSIFPRMAESLKLNQDHYSSRLTIVDADKSVKMLSDGICDFLLGFGHYRIDRKMFRSVIIGRVPMLPVCKRNQDGQPLYSLDALTASNERARIPLLDYSEDIFLGRVVRKIRSQAERQFGNRLSFQTLVESTMADNLKALALSGLGIAWIPRCAIETELANGQLAVCGSDEWQSELTIQLYRQDRQLEAHKEAIWSEFEKLYYQAAPTFESLQQAPQINSKGYTKVALD